MSSVKNKEELFVDISQDWLLLLNNNLLNNVIEYLKEEKNITPPIDKIFEFARLTPLKKIKIVILGQDPYPKAGDAHGLAFSCLTNVPASLLNIYKCLKKHNWIKTIPNDGDLTYWATQGVLLLNCALTTVVNKPNEHKNIWMEYTNKLITEISKLKLSQPPIFILWGNFAKNKKIFIDEKCKILEWTHPSPLAQRSQSFLDCDNFDNANILLKQIGPIDWNTTEVTDIVSKTFEMNKYKTVVFTDGSCFPNKTCPEAIAGYACVFALGVFKDIAVYGNINNRPNYATNQRAEGTAIYKVLDFLNMHINEWNECIIVSDTDFWINMFENYMPNWERQNFNFNEKKNADLSIKMWDLYKKLKYEFNKIIEFRHVKSHNKNGWKDKPVDSYEYFCWHNNDYVDKLAGFARTNLKPNTDILGRVEYDD